MSSITVWIKHLGRRFPWLLALLLGVGLPLLLFGKTAQEVWTEGGFEFDRSTLLFIHQYATPSLDRVMVLITTSAGATFMPIITLFLGAVFWLRRQQRWAVYLVLAVGGASTIMFVVKALFHRTRPHLWLSPAPETDYGFPSGHSIASSSLCLALILLAWPTRWRWPVLVIAVSYAVLVAFSRLYLGVHYPSDVLAAWGAGVAWTAGLHWVLFRARPVV